MISTFHVEYWLCSNDDKSIKNYFVIVGDGGGRGGGGGNFRGGGGGRGGGRGGFNRFAEQGPPEEVWIILNFFIGRFHRFKRLFYFFLTSFSVLIVGRNNCTTIKHGLGLEYTVYQVSYCLWGEILNIVSYKCVLGLDMAFRTTSTLTFIGAI